MIPIRSFLTVLLFVITACSVPGSNDLAVVSLHCDYRESPLGVDSESPSLGWIIESSRRGVIQSAYRILVASSLENLDTGNGDLWDSGKVISGESVNVTYAGKALESRTRCYWKVRIWDDMGEASPWSTLSWWEMGLLTPGDWRAKWISDGKPVPARDEDFFKDDPAPLFRKGFKASKPFKQARLYITGLGYYEAYINGNKIGRQVLNPGWTSYSKRVLYSIFDVTENLAKGENALGVMLGDGWFNTLPMRMWGRLNLREHLVTGRPMFIAQLEIEYTDGTKETVVSDESWAVHDGPIIRNDIYLGELYDARREISGWNMTGLDESDWCSAVHANPPEGKLRVQSQPPIVVTDTIKAESLHEVEPDVFIFDLGENFAGWIRLKAEGPAGTTITLRYGELIYPDGSLNVMTSTCGQIKPGARNQPKGTPLPACQQDIFILAGAGTETYTPRFTFHGFRYVEVKGYPGTPTLDAIDGLRLHADVGTAGNFECSDPLLNRIQDITRRTFLSNIFSVQSDCPQRERFGYGGDIVPTCEAFMFNFNMSGLYPKIAADFEDAARPGGGMTETAPYVGIEDRAFGNGSGPVGWTLAYPLLMERLYSFYGNTRLIEEHYLTAKALVEFLRSHATGHCIENGISDHESLDPKPTALTSTAFYYRHVEILADLAAIIGKNDEADLYTVLANDIREAFIKRFLQVGTGRFSEGTQASQAVAIRYGLVPESVQAAAFGLMVNEVIETHTRHLATGIFGTSYLLETLSENGRADLAYDIVSQKTFPGWGHMLENGATTLWEHWEYSDNTYSHNHPMFGSVSEWFFRTVAGINNHPDALAFDRIAIRPGVATGLEWATGSYESVRGRIESSWRIENGLTTLKVVVPCNATAEIHVPVDRIDGNSMNSVTAVNNKGVTFLQNGEDGVVIEVGSGEYQFTWRQ